MMIFRRLLSLLDECFVNCLRSRLVRALVFTKSGIYVNPARVSPNVFVAEFGRLKLREPSSVAVCIMTGIITDCAIISEGITGGPDNEKTVHKVSLAPFRQDFRRDTTMWGKILNFDNISCAISTEGISFTTKPRTLSAPIFASSRMYCFSLVLQVTTALISFVSSAVLSESLEKSGFPLYDCHAQSGTRPPLRQLYYVSLF